MSKLTPVLTAGILAATAHVGWGAETRVVVRARTKDAKFIGTSMGGAQVVIRRADTGEVLASGTTSGGTGDTTRIMVEPHVRGKRITDDATAAFEARLELAEPTFATIEVTGPLGQPRAAAQATVQSWLLPGRHVTGDGIVVEIPGFAVRVEAPRARDIVRREAGAATVPIGATVVMMCGCPTTPGGMWDAARYEVRAVVKRDGRPAGDFALAPGPAASSFVGTLTAGEPGTYEVTVSAFDPATGNAGVDRVEFEVR